MKSFLGYIIQEQKSIEAAKKSGKQQYVFAAKLAAHLNPTTHSSVPDLSTHIETAFNNNGIHEIHDTIIGNAPHGIKVGKFNTPDASDKDKALGHDIVYYHNGQRRNIEVIGGGGKMISSVRNPNKSITIETLQTKNPLLYGLIQHGAKTGNLDLNTVQSRLQKTGKGGYRRLTSREISFPEGAIHGAIIHRDPEQNFHTGMEFIENHMKTNKGTTHWGIGNHLIPVGALKHFVEKIVITQGSEKIPRLAARIGGIIDPLTKEKIKTSEKNWHSALNNLLHSYGEHKEGQEFLNKLQIEKISEPSSGRE